MISEVFEGNGGYRIYLSGDVLGWLLSFWVLEFFNWNHIHQKNQYYIVDPEDNKGKVVVSLEPTSEEESREKKTSGTVSRDNPIIAMFDEYSQLSWLEAFLCFPELGYLQHSEQWELGTLPEHVNCPAWRVIVWGVTTQYDAIFASVMHLVLLPRFCFAFVFHVMKLCNQ